MATESLQNHHIRLTAQNWLEETHNTVAAANNFGGLEEGFLSFCTSQLKASGVSVGPAWYSSCGFDAKLHGGVLFDLWIGNKLDSGNADAAQLTWATELPLINFVRARRCVEMRAPEEVEVKTADRRSDGPVSGTFNTSISSDDDKGLTATGL